MPKNATSKDKSLSDIARTSRSALVGLWSALLAGLTVYGEYHLGSS